MWSLLLILCTVACVLVIGADPDLLVKQIAALVGNQAPICKARFALSPEVLQSLIRFRVIAEQLEETELEKLLGQTYLPHH